MIRFVRAPIATSIQDRGRFGARALGHARSGAMDQSSLEGTNRLAGAAPGAAVVELGPGPCILEVTRAGTIAFGGARREGALWWETIEASAGSVFELSPTRDGVWSYLGVAGGVAAPVVLGSRSTSVREGIGRWISTGDMVVAGNDYADPQTQPAIAMTGEIRIFGSLPGSWRVGASADRMGYALAGNALATGRANEWSEPLLPGFVQVPPGGTPIVLMTEGPTVGGYPVAAVVHSQDLRLVAQTRPGDPVSFVSA